MDFQFSEEEQNFRQEVRQFIKDEFPSNWEIPSLWLVFSDDKLWNISRQMANKLAKKGWLALGWPKEYGGLARSHTMQSILAEELAYRGVPGIDIFGGKMLSPVLMAFGTEEQKRKHLPPIARGEKTWAQAFSEPDSGSDLASVKVQAREDGDYFIVNGQKVWSTGAHRASWIFFLARTDNEGPKHRGISFFLADTKTPGIDIRPLTNILGEQCYNEIFFDNVKIHKEDMVGEKNQGWRVAMALMNTERSGVERSAESRRYLEKLLQLVKDDFRKSNSTLIRRRLTQLAMEIEIARLLAYRVSWLQNQGIEVTHEASMSKIYGSELMQRLANCAMDILGDYGQLEGGSKWVKFNGQITAWYLSSFGHTIAAGTSEIQRNTIALRGLKLAKE